MMNMMVPTMNTQPMSYTVPMTYYNPTYPTAQPMTNVPIYTQPVTAQHVSTQHATVQPTAQQQYHTVQAVPQCVVATPNTMNTAPMMPMNQSSHQSVPTNTTSTNLSGQCVSGQCVSGHHHSNMQHNPQQNQATIQVQKPPVTSAVPTSHVQNAPTKPPITSTQPQRPQQRASDSVGVLPKLPPLPLPSTTATTINPFKSTTRPATTTNSSAGLADYFWL